MNECLICDSKWFVCKCVVFEVEKHFNREYGVQQEKYAKLRNELEVEAEERSETKRRNQGMR